MKTSNPYEDIATVATKLSSVTGGRRRTLESIFHHPSAHNLEWSDVVALATPTRRQTASSCSTAPANVTPCDVATGVNIVVVGHGAAKSDAAYHLLRQPCENNDASPSRSRHV